MREREDAMWFREGRCSLPTRAVRRDDVGGAPTGRTHVSKAKRGKLCQEEGLAWAEAWRWRSIGHVRVPRAT